MKREVQVMKGETVILHVERHKNIYWCNYRMTLRQHCSDHQESTTNKNKPS